MRPSGALIQTEPSSQTPSRRLDLTASSVYPDNSQNFRTVIKRSMLASQA
ncbi:hypothetical protein LMG31841_02876 [Paraburkholderia saeva]|uniref:Uncharacterized protein n=1 Tax=Paraburkholderia saeva TaxID=2777537 RepID=A0A9N8RX10_9BURK|nr:hypothetical protein LMG31841_02876 [Paraburkholderia saeva]